MDELISKFDYYLQFSPLLAILLAYLAGVVTSFTPCVYPVIPITVGFIGAQGANSKSRGFFLSLFYVLGLAVVYSSLGAFAALTGRLFGSLSTSPLAYFMAANICIFFGLSMFDVIIIQAPSFIRNHQFTGGKSRGIISAFFFGAISGFVIAPCTAPVLGTLLAFEIGRAHV